MLLICLFLFHADQFFKVGWKMVMLGDETWLKLFPELFIRSDGVGSFFVSISVADMKFYGPYNLHMNTLSNVLCNYCANYVTSLIYVV